MFLTVLDLTNRVCRPYCLYLFQSLTLHPEDDVPKTNLLSYTHRCPSLDLFGVYLEWLFVKITHSIPVHPQKEVLTVHTENKTLSLVFQTIPLPSPHIQWCRHFLIGSLWVVPFQSSKIHSLTGSRNKRPNWEFFWIYHFFF